MSKGFLQGLRKEEVHQTPTESYIDLGALEEAGALPAVDGGGGMSVKVAEIHRYEELHELLNLLYAGSFLVIDYTAVSAEDLTMSRITNELRTAVADIKGDMVALKKNILLVGPTGVRIDRRIFRGSVV